MPKNVSNTTMSLGTINYMIYSAKECFFALRDESIAAALNGMINDTDENTNNRIINDIQNYIPRGNSSLLNNLRDQAVRLANEPEPNNEESRQNIILSRFMLTLMLRHARGIDIKDDPDSQDILDHMHKLRKTDTEHTMKNWNNNAKALIEPEIIQTQTLFVNIKNTQIPPRPRGQDSRESISESKRLCDELIKNMPRFDKNDPKAMVDFVKTLSGRINKDDLDVLEKQITALLNGCPKKYGPFIAHFDDSASRANGLYALDATTPESKLGAALFLIHALRRAQEPEQAALSSMFRRHRDKDSKIEAAMTAYQALLSFEEGAKLNRGSPDVGRFTVPGIKCEISAGLRAALTTDRLGKIAARFPFEFQNPSAKTTALSSEQGSQRSEGLLAAAVSESRRPSSNNPAPPSAENSTIPRDDVDSLKPF